MFYSPLTECVWPTVDSDVDGTNPEVAALEKRASRIRQELGIKKGQ